MPFVLKHKESSEIYACPLINKYDFEYYGVKAWDDPAEANAEYAAFLSVRGAAPSDWELAELEERQLKICNVRLNNDTSRAVFLGDGGIIELRPKA